MTTTGGKRSVFTTATSSFLFLRNGGGGLECHAAVNGFAVADSTEGTARVVGAGVVGVAVKVKFVVVLAAVHASRGKAASDFEALASGNAEHCLGEQGV